MDAVIGHNKRITVMNTTVDVLSMQDTIDLVEEYILNKIPLHLMGVNADKINELNKNPQLKTIVNGCGVINADGASVVLASRFLGKPLPERVAGIDLMQRLLELSNQKGYSVYFLGARQEIVEEMVMILRNQYPKLIIKGFRNGYFRREDWNLIAEEVRVCSPDIVFVGITSPLKEYLVDYLQSQHLDRVFMGVGGSFDVLSGKIPRAPKWMQKLNLEWLFRVLQEPKRLFKRYFYGNLQFLCKVLREKIGVETK